MIIGRDGFPDSFVHSIPDPRAPNVLVPTTFTRFMPVEVIRTRNPVVAEAMVGDYSQSRSGRPPIFMVVLRGAMRWAVELSEEIARIDPHLEPEVDTIVCSSYGKGTASGTLRIHKGPSEDIKDRDVVIVEDIIDSGNTLRALVRYLLKSNPSSVAVAAMLQREAGVRHLASTPPELRPTVHIPNPRSTPNIEPVLISYAGFDIVSGFVAGHGLDMGENGGFRAWPDIYAPEGPRAFAPSRILGLNPELVAGPGGMPMTSWAMENAVALQSQPT